MNLRPLAGGSLWEVTDFYPTYVLLVAYDPLSSNSNFDERGGCGLLARRFSWLSSMCLCAHCYMQSGKPDYHNNLFSSNAGLKNLCLGNIRTMFNEQCCNNRTVQAGLACNCDSGGSSWQEDGGNITEPKHLPVAALHFGDTGNPFDQKKGR